MQLSCSCEPTSVDLITTSFDPYFRCRSLIEDATKVAVVEEKKIHTGAADNSPSPAIQDSTAGPPWSIGVSVMLKRMTIRKRP